MEDVDLLDRTKAQTPRNVWKTLRSLIEHLMVFRVRIIVAFVFLILAKVATINVPITLKKIVDWFDTALNPEIILIVPVFLIVAYCLLSLASTLCEELRNALFSRAQQRAARNIALEVFQHLHQLSHAYHQNRQTGGISRDIERGTRGIIYLLWYTVFSIIPTFFEITVICTILAINFDAKFVLITAGTIFIYFWFTYFVTRWRTKFRVQMNAAESRAGAVSVDALLNYETVQYFCNEEHEYNRFDFHMKEWERLSVISEQTLALLNIGQGTIIAVGSITLLYIAGQGVVADELTLGEFIMLNAFLMQMYIPLRFLGSTFREINHALTDMARMLDLLDVQEKLPEVSDAPQLKVSNANIQFDHVGFGYSDQRVILNDVSFNVPSGQKVAVVGKSGSGKSTLVRLLFRFYDVTSGQITIDGQDLRDVDLQSIHASIGVVPQDTVLFNESIEYNIRYGSTDCTESEFIEAVKQANLYEFIESLPEKYDTVVGERGLKLSGGEKQRVSIARTILKDPPILVLDEATSSLDSKSEKLIQAALDVVAENRTTLVIAHRLSTIADADMILVLDDGEIVEQGNHSDLLELNGLFAEMWWLQQVEETEAKLAQLAANTPPVKK